MKTKFLVQQLGPNKKAIWTTSFNLKKDALESYSDLCESFPADKFVVVRSVTTEEIIAESEDVRQTRFDFAL
jgi:hypothetical protein